MIARASACAAALVLGVLCALALGCGSSDSSKLLAGTDADTLKQRLDAIVAAVDARKPGTCLSLVQQLESDVANLPASVSPKLKANLREEISTKLAPTATEECEDVKTDTVPTITESTPSTQTTQTTQTTPPPPTTETTSTVPPPTTPPTATTPPADPGGATIPEPGSGADPGGFGQGSDE